MKFGAVLVHKYSYTALIKYCF